jgi:hypothetical protein
VANSEAVVCWPHRISLHTLCGLAAVVTHHIVGLWRVFGLKSCRQRVVLMVWREDAWTLDGFRESRRARGSKIEAGAVGAWATSPLARSANWQACPNTNINSLLDDWMHLRDPSRQQSHAFRTFDSLQTQCNCSCFCAVQPVAQS